MAQTSPIEDAYIDGIIKASGVYNPDLNRTQGVKLRELIKKMRDRMEDNTALNAKFDYVAPNNDGILNL